MDAEQKNEKLQDNISNFFGNSSVQHTLGNMATGGLTGLINFGLGKLAAKENAYLNYTYNEKAAENADRRTRALYEDYMSPSSRIAQLKAAGLSPSLFADGAGAGSQGVTAGAQGAGTSGVGIPTNLMSPMDIAQIRLANAQAKKAEAEAETESGGNSRGMAEIAKTWAEAGATKAAEALTNTENALKKIDLHISEETQEFSITRAKYDCEKAMDDARRTFWEAEDASLQFQYDAATFSSRVEQEANRAAELAARIALENSQTKLNDEEKQAIKHYIVQGYTNIAIAAKNANAYEKQVNAYADNLPKQLELRSKEIGLEKWRIGVDAFNNLVRTAGYVCGASQLGDGGTTTNETFEHMNKDGKVTNTTRHSRTTTRLPKVR